MYTPPLHPPATVTISMAEYKELKRAQLKATQMEENSEAYLCKKMAAIVLRRERYNRNFASDLDYQLKSAGINLQMIDPGQCEFGPEHIKLSKL